MAKPLRLQQGQVWKRGDAFLRIVRLERMAVDYKTSSSPAIKAGIVHQVTKKEFCRLLKTATLLPSAPAPGPRPVRPV